MFHRPAHPTPILITELDAPHPAVPVARLRLWERAVLVVSAPVACSPVVACLVTGHAGPWAFGLVAAPLAVLGIVVHCVARENKPVLPDPFPAWYVAWSQAAVDEQPGRAVEVVR